MELPISSIYGSILNDGTRDVIGCSSRVVQQLLLTAYSPKISVISSNNADKIASNFNGKLQNIHHLFTYFENIFSFGNEFNKPITNKQNKGCVRFVNDVLKFDTEINNNQELFNLEFFNKQLNDYVKIVDDKIRLLSDESLNYDTYHKDYDSIVKLQNSIYLKLISLLHLSDSLSSFECFNHPIMQLIVVTGNDDLEDIENLISTLKKRKFPKWFDLNSILQHIMILVNNDDSEMLQKGLKIQEHLKIVLGKQSTIVSINFEPSIDTEDDRDQDVINLYPSIFSRIEKLDDSSINEDLNILKLNRNIINSWKKPLQELISKDMIVFMSNKINQWNEEVVGPRTSLTGRIFGGRKWGGGNKNNFFSFSGSTGNRQLNDKNKDAKEEAYNTRGGYYLAESVEMTLRKLGDWYFMLGDYKNAHSTYELIKKDLVNDKAYSHLASLQEFTVLSLLLGAANKTGANTQSITSKMVSTVINPVLESSFYSYLSRCNLKTYTIRSTILAAEAYFLIGQNSIVNLEQGIPISSIEMFFNESMTLFKKIIDSKLLKPLSNAFLMQRVAYSYKSYNEIPASITKNLPLNEPFDSYYESVNECKARVMNPNINQFGLVRNRKMILWLLLSAKDLDPELQPLQTQLIVWRIEDQLGPAEKIWLERQDGLLYKIKSKLPL